MGVFGFIENFFFISLGIVFGLALLLVYHFKKRMSVAEKKSESMYGLLSTVVKEIKNIRNTFGQPSSSPNPPFAQVKSKTDPEISVDVKHPAAAAQVITLELNASEPTSLVHAQNKIVVSDDDDDDDESEEEEEDEESVEESESEPESDDDESVEELENIVLEPLQVFEEVIDLGSTIVIEELAPEPDKDDVVDAQLEKLSAEYLRKMNINQLRTIAIQRGITSDTSKIKKNELISLIQAK